MFLTGTLAGRRFLKQVTFGCIAVLMPEKVWAVDPSPGLYPLERFDIRIIHRRENGVEAVLVPAEILGLLYRQRDSANREAILVIDPSAVEIVHDRTAKLIGESVAILLDGEEVSSPMVREPLWDLATISPIPTKLLDRLVKENPDPSFNNEQFEQELSQRQYARALKSNDSGFKIGVATGLLKQKRYDDALSILNTMPDSPEAGLLRTMAMSEKEK
jgi:hypothetical protein